MAEDHKERVDRELIELLNEIRVVLPGAQVLFAFLLTLPFTQRFEALSAADRDAYFAAFLCTARRHVHAHGSHDAPPPAVPRARQGAHAPGLQQADPRRVGVPARRP